MIYAIHSHRRLCCILLAFILACCLCVRPYAVALAAAPIAVAATSAVAAILIAAGLTKSGDGFNAFVDDIIAALRLSLPQLFTPAGLLFGFLVDGKSYFSEELIDSALGQAAELGAFSGDTYGAANSEWLGVVSNSPVHYYLFDGSITANGVTYTFDRPVYLCPIFDESRVDGDYVYSFIWCFSPELFTYYQGGSPRTPAGNMTDYGQIYGTYFQSYQVPSNFAVYNSSKQPISGSTYRNLNLPGQLYYAGSSIGGVSGVSSSGAYDGTKPLDEQINDTITRWIQSQAVIDSAGTEVSALPLSVADSYPDAVAQDQSVAQGGYISVGTAQAGQAAADQAAADADFAETESVFAGVRDFAFQHIAPALAPLLDKFPLSIPYDCYLIVSALGGSVPDGLSGVASLDPHEVDVTSPGVAALADDDYIYTVTLELPYMDPITADLDFTPWLGVFGALRVMLGLVWTAMLLRWASGKGVS